MAPLLCCSSVRGSTKRLTGTNFDHGQRTYTHHEGAFLDGFPSFPLQVGALLQITQTNVASWATRSLNLRVS